MEQAHRTPVKTDQQHEVPVRTMRTPATTPKNIAKYILLSHNSSSFTAAASSSQSPSLGIRAAIRNPFESQLQDRLHLPLISSPSLFQVSTPNDECNEEFVWSIDDISCLRPQNILPHSTQFEESYDPVVESQAQAAITTFFSENINVPSPQDCWLRKQKIVLKEDTTTEIVNSTALKAVTSKEIACQTQLTFPPLLPAEVEAMLRKYNMLNVDEDEAGHDVSHNNSMMNISTLRKKLFIQHMESPELPNDQVNAVALSPPPRTPDLKQSCDHDDAAAADNVINSAKINSTSIDLFGELSPIHMSSPYLLSPCNMSFGGADVSMRSNDKTPLRVLRKYPKKNLSESFCMMQEDADTDEMFDEEKRIFRIKSDGSSSSSSRIRFGRFDSGFDNDDCSNDMQF